MQFYELGMKDGGFSKIVGVNTGVQGAAKMVSLDATGVRWIDFLIQVSFSFG